MARLACKAASLVITTISVLPLAAAADSPTAITITCDNGRTYVLAPRAVSDAGDIVTARLYTAPRRAVAVRLIPMGSGYRYAGRGIWLDGIRGQAMLNFGKSATTACEVTPSLTW